jgi:hypothetical protein
MPPAFVLSQDQTLKFNLGTLIPSREPDPPHSNINGVVKLRKIREQSSPTNPGHRPRIPSITNNVKEQGDTTGCRSVRPSSPGRRGRWLIRLGPEACQHRFSETSNQPKRPVAAVRCMIVRIRSFYPRPILHLSIDAPICCGTLHGSDLDTGLTLLVRTAARGHARSSI